MKRCTKHLFTSSNLSSTSEWCVRHFTCSTTASKRKRLWPPGRWEEAIEDWELRKEGISSVLVSLPLLGRLSSISMLELVLIIASILQVIQLASGNILQMCCLDVEQIQLLFPTPPCNRVCMFTPNALISQIRASAPLPHPNIHSRFCGALLPCTH